MEFTILEKMDYELPFSNAHFFLTLILATVEDEETRDPMLAQLSEMVLDSTLFNGDLYFDYLPSTLAAASIAVARRALGSSIWCPTLQDITGYKEQPIESVANAIKASKAAIPKDLTNLRMKWAKHVTGICPDSIWDLY